MRLIVRNCHPQDYFWALAYVESGPSVYLPRFSTCPIKDMSDPRRPRIGQTTLYFTRKEARTALRTRLAWENKNPPSVPRHPYLPLRIVKVWLSAEAEWA